MSTTPKDLDGAFAALQELVADFEANFAHYTSASYQELEARTDFIDKLFIALGWDVRHEGQKNPFEQEVKVERSVVTGPAKRRADYAFFIAPNFRDARFIGEAKKPHGTLATSDNYFQAIRYGWNKQNPVAVLTNFEHFHALDCRYKPDIDAAIHCCLRKWHLQDYGKRDSFAELYWLFSREAVANGSLEKFAATLAKPHGKTPQRKLFTGAYKGLDESFLEDLDGYRVTLARAFKSRDAGLDSDALTEATQRTLDRLVFMRFLEDKLIEPSHFVANFGERGPAWRDFTTASRRLDAIYNGVVFKKHDILDAGDFAPDDDAFAKVCGELSHRDSPYDFNSIPIHILGSIYERFLGNVIVATDKRVRVEPKPAVRKAGGVYYTPDFVVNYIVEHAIGGAIEGMAPSEIAELRFADIACGSGSFLLAVYDLLLRYHLRFYNENPRKARKGDCVTKDGVLHLSVEKKREILLNNIYGTDIDQQAVEVTQLSLYLKLLDEETIASARDYQLRIHQAILPSLDRNIICGNSLIGRDITSGNLFAEEDEKRFNPMNFEDAFPLVMRAGGFDAIVGNPPWGADFCDTSKRYFDRKYTINAGKYESYIFFVEAATRILKDRGRFGMILPSYWVSRSQTGKLKHHLMEAVKPETFVVLPDNVFANVKMDACIYTGVKGASKRKVAVAEIPARDFPQYMELGYLDRQLKDVAVADWQAIPRARFNPRINNEDLPIIRKVDAAAGRLGDFVEITQGLTLYRRSTLAKEYGVKRANDIVKNRAFHADHKKDDSYKKELSGRDVDRYYAKWNGKSWVSYGPWLAHAVDERFFQGPRIVVQKLRNPSLKQRLVAGYLDDSETYSAGVLLNLIARPDSDVPLLFFLGLLNSKLLNFWYRKCILDVSIRVADLEQLPVPAIDADNVSQAVKSLLDATTRAQKARTDRDKNFYRGRCSALDRQIDEAIYRLYGLTAKEAVLVEASAAASDSRKKKPPDTPLLTDDE